MFIDIEVLLLDMGRVINFDFVDLFAWYSESYEEFIHFILSGKLLIELSLHYSLFETTLITISCCLTAPRKRNLIK